jgi:hypothetical protein
MFYGMIREDRPSMVRPESQKDAAYHRKMLRADVSSLNTGALEAMHAKSIVAEKFYNDKQLTQEDIDTWLLDETKNTRNRVMFGFNMVKPVIEQLRGSALQMEFNATVQAVTKGTRTRRMNQMYEAMIMHSASQTSPDLHRAISKYYNLGKTMEQTLATYADMDDGFNRAMNHLLRQAVSRCDFGRFTGHDAFLFTITGINAQVWRDGGTYLRPDSIHPRELYYDMANAQKPDLSDGSFMGCMPRHTMPRIAELWEVDRKTLALIDESIRQYAWAGDFSGINYSLLNQTQIRVFENYWVDEMNCEFGYIMQYGVPTLVRFGEYGEYENDKPKYSRNDLIKPPDNERNREKFGKELTAWSTAECARYCVAIPVEYLAGRSADEKMLKNFNDDLCGDLVLDYGVCPDQPYNPYDPIKVQLPIQATTFALADGEVLSPIQAVIDPNRFTNRVMGSLEMQANMSGPKNNFLDMDVVDEIYQTEDIDVALSKGKTIKLRNGGRGASNAISSHDNNMGSGAYALLQIVQSVQEMMRSVTGVHQPMTGESQKDQLVGVTEILIQRGAIMQEGFFANFADLKLQGFRFLATAGKEYYMARPDVLMDMIQEDDLLPLFFTRGMELERFNATVARDNGDGKRRAAANQWLDLLLERQLIDLPFYAKYYNNSYVEDISPALNRYALELQQAQQKAAEDAQMQQAAQGLVMEQEKLDEERREVEDAKAKSAQELAKEGAKSQSKVEVEKVKAALEPPPAPAAPKRT